MNKIILPMLDHTGGKLSALVITALANGAKSENIDADTFALIVENADDAKAINNFINPPKAEKAEKPAK